MMPTTTDLSLAKSLSQQFINFLHASPSPYHAVKNLTNLTSTLNPPVVPLSFSSEWKLTPGKNFNPSVGSFNIIASHTDSPCLKLTYNHSSLEKGLYIASVQCYGGGLWNTWVDRGLGFAGKVIIKKHDPEKKYTLEERLISILKPIFYIPNLAIHLRDANERKNFPLDLEKHLKPIISSQLYKSLVDDSDRPPLITFLAKELNVAPDDILDFDLRLVDTHPPELGGVYDEFINSGRLDNLASCFITLNSFIETLKEKPDSSELSVTVDDVITVIAHYNYEEIGSQAHEGAQSTTTVDILMRILLNLNCTEDEMTQFLARSFVTSVDMAHAVHPLYPERHQKEHQPELHNGVVIKSNPNMAYSTDLKTSTIIQHLAAINNIKVQYFRVANTSPCGSTIGPYLSRSLGCDTVDVGICQFAMHSIREFCGVLDILHLSRLTKAIITHLPSVRASYSLV